MFTYLNKNQKSKARILDYGCGSGHFLLMVKKMGLPTCGMKMELVVFKANTMTICKVVSSGSGMNLSKYFHKRTTLMENFMANTDCGMIQEN